MTYQSRSSSPWKSGWFLGLVLSMIFLFAAFNFWPFAIALGILFGLIMVGLDLLGVPFGLVVPLTFITYYLICTLIWRIFKNNKRFARYMD